MAGYEDAERDPEGRHGNVAPGGAATRGPNSDPGGEVDIGDNVPNVRPHAQRTEVTDTKAERSEGVSRMMSGGTAPEDTNPESLVGPTGGGGAEMAPEDVGVSTTTRGEDVGDHDGQERGRQDTGEDGAGRPTGTSDMGDSSGVGQSETVSGGPDLQSGSQG